jgi:hypothetical protein
MAAAFQGMLLLGVNHQDLPHQARCRSVEMSAALPVRHTAVYQAKIGFVHQVTLAVATAFAQIPSAEPKICSLNSLSRL